MQQEQLAEYETLDEEPGYTYEEIGECLLLLDRRDEGRAILQARLRCPFAGYLARQK